MIILIYNIGIYFTKNLTYFFIKNKKQQFKITGVLY